jgi:hypothetical protein
VIIVAEAHWPIGTARQRAVYAALAFADDDSRAGLADVT